MDEHPFDTPEIRKLQEEHSVTFTYDYSWETPIYDSLCAIHRYDGGWAFEDNCPNWRPWSDAWTTLCGALLVHEWDSAVERIRGRIKAHIAAKPDYQPLRDRLMIDL